MSVDAIIKQVEELSLEQREELLERLSELFEVPDDEPIELSDEMKSLLDKREAAYEANPTDLRTWEEVMASIRRKRC